MILLVAVIGLAMATALAILPAQTAREPNTRDADGPDMGGRQTGGGDRGRLGVGGALFRGAVHSEPEPAALGPADRRPSTLEGVLVEQLIKGDISRRQYLRALEKIAVRDEERHPLSIPRDDLPGACA